MTKWHRLGKMFFQARRFGLFLLSLLLFSAMTSKVYGHRVYIFAWAEGDTVYTESYFPGKKRVKGGLIKVFDPSGVKILEGRTDDSGAFSFKIPKVVDLRLVLEAGMGHKTEYIFKAEEMNGRSSEPTTREEGADEHEIRSEIPGTDLENIRVVAEEAIENKLSPIRKQLARMERENKVSLRDILGGIGYILGLMGIALYFKSKKNK